MRLQLPFYSTLCHFKTILQNIIFSDSPQRLWPNVELFKSGDRSIIPFLSDYKSAILSRLGAKTLTDMVPTVDITTIHPPFILTSHVEPLILI